MRIDVHAHYWTDDYLDLLAGLGHTDTGTQRGLGAGGGGELDARLRLMDRAGVDMQVLSASPQLPYGEDRDKAVAAARFVNDQYAVSPTKQATYSSGPSTTSPIRESPNTRPTPSSRATPPRCSALLAQG